MADATEDFFGEIAQGKVPRTAAAQPKSARQSSGDSTEDFFSSIASGEFKGARRAPAAAPAKPPSLLERGAQLQARTMRGISDWYAQSPAVSLLELGASGLTGIEGGIEGLIRGGIDLAQGEGLEQASDTVSQTMAERTYEPQSYWARRLAEGLGTLEREVFQPIAAPIEQAIGPTGSKAVGSFGTAALSAAPAAALARAAPAAARSILRPAPVNVADMPPRAPPGGPAAPAPPRAPATASGGAAPELQASPDPRARPYTELEGEAAPRFVEETPVADAGHQLPMEQRVRRAQILDRIGLAEPRTSALTGDVKAAATDFQSSKLDTEGGYFMSGVFDAERAALENFATRIVEDTRGTPGVGQTELLQRGANIVAPLDDLKRYFDDGIQSLYRAADERAGAIGINTPSTASILADESQFLGTVEGEALLRGVRARMRSLEMIDPEGNIQPTTVATAERLRQYLGDQWTPRTSRLIRRLKDSVDDDVMQAAGADIYENSRALRRLRARVLDDPKGIARIMDAEGPEGINRSVPIEKIPDAITTLPVDQFRHVVRTLQGVPDELRGVSDAALNEIKAQFANKIYEIGSRQATQWNARGVSQYLNANSARMNSLFTPEEMQQFATLNDAGHILRFPASYPGAAVQAQNLARTGMGERIETAMTGAGAAVGAVFGDLTGVAGAAVGQRAGSAINRRLESRASLRAAQRRTSRLSDLLERNREAE